MTRFATDTAVHALGGGRYGATIDRGWWIERGPNGGFLAAVVLRAIQTEVADPARRPRTLTLHYLRPPAEGDCEVEVVVERAGRGLTTVTARLRQGDQDCVLAIAALGHDRPGPELHDHPMPGAPRPEVLAPPVYPAASPPVPIRERYEIRPCLGWAPFIGAGEALSGGWIRGADDEPVDHELVAAITDAWIPALFSTMSIPTGVPTVELTIHFRNAPPATPGWCLVRFQTREVSEGYLEESGEVWSEDGTLLAECRQLAVLLAPS